MNFNYRDENKKVNSFGNSLVRVVRVHPGDGQQPAVLEGLAGLIVALVVLVGLHPDVVGCLACCLIGPGQSHARPPAAVVLLELDGVARMQNGLRWTKSCSQR